MTFLLQRQPSTDGVTLGELFLDGVHEAYTLEPAEGIGPDAAIQPGRYRVILNHSTRFNRRLPLVIGVPGRLGIRFHPGNTGEDTEGCILLGTTIKGASVLHSRDAVIPFQALLEHTIAKGEDVWLTVQSAPSARTLTI